MEHIKRTRHPITYFSDKIVAGEVFSFSRYGDGEWSAMLGKKGANCDGHSYLPAMGKELKVSVAKPRPKPLIYGIQNMSARKMADKIRPFLKKDFEYDWADSDVFHYASWNEKLYPMVEALRGKKVCHVGPDYLVRKPLGFLTTAGRVSIPKRNCYKHKKRIKDGIIHYAKPGVVFAMCASMLTEVLIWELFPQIGKTSWMIDFGSVWDPYVKNPTRRYHKHVTPPVRKKNIWG